MKAPFRFVDDFVSLFYPRLCLACGKSIPPNQEAVCITCQYKLPKTDFHLELDNAFTNHFIGRIKIESAASLYHFVKEGRTQHLIHQLKYKKKKEIGLRLGLLYGKTLKESPYFQSVELIVPVPLHPRKEQKRGYNQSDLFAKGLSDSMEVPWNPKGLKRKEMTSTQTKKTRIERFENVENAFAVQQFEKLKGKHILLVDDVMTTGATLEACVGKILEIPDTKISLATIAFAIS